MLDARRRDGIVVCEANCPAARSGEVEVGDDDGVRKLAQRKMRDEIVYKAHVPCTRITSDEAVIESF